MHPAHVEQDPATRSALGMGVRAGLGFMLAR